MGALRPARPEPLGQHSQCAPGGMEEGVVGFSPGKGDRDIRLQLLI